MLNPDKLFGRLGNRMFQMAYIYSQMKRGAIQDIYVQDPVYFERYKDYIKDLFGDGIGSTDKVGIHVRRGDYVDNPFYVDLMKTSYYQKAIAMFPNDKFLVFSDDIEWCMKQPIFERMSFSVGLSELDDLNLLASCKAVIMANSSFSWWAGYLSKGKVIAPKAYYTDGVVRTKYPKEWITL